MKKVSNNFIAILTIIFMIVSVTGNMVIYEMTKVPRVTGKSTGQVSLCSNAPPILQPISDQTAYINQLFTLFINASDLNNDYLTFYDNTDLFNITNYNASTGLINFTPSSGDAGYYSIIINVTDNVSCESNSDIKTFNFNISGEAPNVIVLYPNRSEVLFGIALINASVSDDDGNNTINYVNFYYSNNSIDWVFIGSDTYDNNIIYNLTWNTTTAPDGYKYKIKVNASDGVLIGEDTSDNRFTINNIDEEPIWDEFKNKLTTNFTALNNITILGEFTSVPNVTIGVTDYGLINFTGHVLNVDGLNLDENINITYMNISFNSDELFNLNKSAILTFYNITLINPKLYRNDVECPSSICTKIRYSNNEYVANVSYFTRYRIIDGGNSNLEIWDETDIKGGSLIRFANNITKFFANYTNATTNDVINGSNIYCEIGFNNSIANMSYNSSSKLYEFNRTFKSRGVYNWNVYCVGNSSGYDNANKTDTVLITNTPPTLIKNIPNATWNEDTTINNWIDLDEYFNDTDKDVLSFTHTDISNININIDNTTHQVDLTPDANWYGTRTVYFIANDSINTTTSNAVILTVIDVPEPLAQVTGGGGGGGGPGYTCQEDWYCTSWSVCINNLRNRTCIDLNNCGTERYKPNETESCVYIETCYDGIRNNGEQGIDCGGPCPPCFTCYDRIQNQGETGIDCGGPCKPCPSCNDSIQNQGETGIDCGGPCKPCPTCDDGIQNQGETGIDCGGPCKPCAKEVLAPIRKKLGTIFMLIILSLIGIVGLLLTYNLTYPYILDYIERLKWITRVKEVKPKLKIEEDIKTELFIRLTEIEKEILRKDVRYLVDKFVNAVNEFFLKIISAKYKMTYEELQKEIDKLPIHSIFKEIIKDYIKTINDIKFGFKRVNKKDIRSLIRKTHRIVYLMEESQIKKLHPKEVDINELLGFVSKSHLAIKEGKIKDVLKNYKKAMEIYNQAPIYKKRTLYPTLKKLYDRINKLDNKLNKKKGK
jgi:hypothetical protein